MARLLTREEARRRKVKFQIFAGMFDFLAVIAGFIVVIACIILISALVRWVTVKIAHIVRFTSACVHKVRGGRQTTQSERFSHGFMGESGNCLI